MYHLPCSWWRCANRIGLFLVLLLVLCFLWGSVNTTEPELHLRNLRLMFLGFSGLNVASFVLAAIQVYVWAYIGVGLWQLVGCCFKSGQCQHKE